MKKYKLAIHYFVFFLAIQILLPFPLFAADTVGKFNELRGDVSLTRAKKSLKPDVGDDIQIKDIVTTGDKSRAKLLLSDDSLLSVSQNSNLEITKFLLYKNRRTSIISLKAGAMHTRVEKFLDPNSTFEVHTPTAVAGARGTAWLTVIEVINNVAQSSIYALEQAVAVFNPALPTQVVTVAAGNFTTVAAGLAPTLPAAFAPAAIQGIVGQLGAQIPAGTGTAAGTGTGAAGAGTGTGAAGAGAGAAGAGAGAATAAGVGAGTVAAGVAGVAAIAAGVAAASSSSGSSTTPVHH
jgi:hypothetical protein